MTLSERKGTISVVTVDRYEGNTHAGQGTLTGLGIVFRKFRKALFGKPNADRGDTEGQFNVQYPEERLQLPEAYRNMPILLFDDATGHELCTSCFQCERVCPPQVIHITQAKDPSTGKPVPAAADFIIEYDTCMSCGYCAEVCPFDAIKMDHDFELSTADHSELDVTYNRLLRPISYYQTLAPTLWSDVKDQALKKLQNNIKRRPGMIGRDHGQKVNAAAAPTAAAARPAAGAAPAAAAARRAPAAKPGKNMSEDKLARLLSIREANKAKLAGGGAVEAAPVDMAPADVAEAVPQAAAPAAGGPRGPVAAIGTNMSEDKVARLLAIREANRAKREE